jgi:parvulin-like peptidyl-prolyl isomerase
MSPPHTHAKEGMQMSRLTGMAAVARRWVGRGIGQGWIRAVRAPGLREFGGLVIVIAAAVGWRLLTGSEQADARPPAAPAAPAQPADQPATMALVNGIEITRDQLVAECVSRHGEPVLEALVNRTIIEQACGRHQITVTAADIDAEIEALSRRFNVPRDQWVEMIRKERGIKPQQYADDIVWPMLALRRLARAAIEPTEEEFTRAFENRFGPAVKARIIVLPTRPAAEKIRALALAAPDDFGGLARQHSIDVGSASANGWVQPIRRHSGDAAFEAVAFGLEEGEISDVVQVADQFIFLKCEGKLPAAEVQPAEVRPRLVEELREEKSRRASNEMFRREQDAATIENVMNDPAKAAARPGVAALVNGMPVTLERVHNECLDRHGEEVLEILITRAIIEQALERQRQKVTQTDLDAEIVRAAESMGFRKADGTADTEAWLARVTREEKISLRHYVDDVVWPTVALKKLIGPVPVTREDLDKAYEATFGARAKCRMVVLDSQRRAQEVWRLARENPTAETIGDLAERYSVDPTSRTLRGEVPPIQRYGGQPALEREAFALKAGELSGVVQVADRFLVLFCEGYTEPAKVSFDEARPELHADILEKKQRIEMARHFTHLRGGAAIDNFLAGTSQSPVGRKGPATPSEAGMPAATLTKAELDDLRKPRAGSRQAPGQPSGSGVVPASHDAPLPQR